MPRNDQPSSTAADIDWSLVTRIVDRLIPEDEFPSGSQAGVTARLASGAAAENRTLWARLLGPGFAALRLDLGERDLDAVTDEELDLIMSQAASRRTGHRWPVDSGEFNAELARVTAEQYYGSHGIAGWRMVGFSPALRRSAGCGTGGGAPLTAYATNELKSSYDVIVVGLGAGGGIAAAELAANGLKVLAVDRGSYLSYEEIGNDHLRNFRLSRYGHNVPPGESAGPRVWVDESGNEEVITQPWNPRWSALPQTIGGGTRLYQGMAWRLLPEDFRLASLYGVPDGSSLADWPIDYDELEPYYSEIEWTVGVCGDASGHRNKGRRSRSYPMPPLPDNMEASVLRRGANRLGWSTGPVPMLINSEPRDGRGRCGQCGECSGFACPVDAKNGPYNTVLPKAMETGNLTLARQTRAERILTGAGGRVTGVAFIDMASGERTSVSAGHVVIACSAIETPRLLLNSGSDAHPSGLGNEADQVGRHLQGHLYLSTFGIFDDPVVDLMGPNVRIATCDHIHIHPGRLGGVLANNILRLPIIHWNSALPPDIQRTGLAGKEAMRHLYRRTSQVHGPIQEIPSPENRVRLSRDVRDEQEIPVAQISGRLHAENSRSADLLIGKGAEWLAAAGARKIWSPPYSLDLTASQHQAGTCRMGNDPRDSVTDPWGRVHGHDNLWIMDGSVHVTNGGFNPVLTIMALALRSARRLAH